MHTKCCTSNMRDCDPSAGWEASERPWRILKPAGDKHDDHYPHGAPAFRQGLTRLKFRHLQL